MGTRIDRLLTRINRSLLLVGGIAMVLMMMQITADVILRYLGIGSVPGTLEIVSTYYMAAVIFLPIGHLQQRRAHISVDLFTKGLRPRRFAALEAVLFLLAAGYVAALFWTGLQEAVRQTLLGEVWVAAGIDMPVWPTRWLVPAGFGLMLVHLLIQSVRDIGFALTGRGVAPPRPELREGVVQ